MMRIKSYFKHNDVNPEDLKGFHVLVIDVLRATSVIITALNNGAKSVRTVAEIEQAFEIKKKSPHVLLSGERNALIIPGFDFGNSPLTMNKDVVYGKELITCTTNGTQAIAAARYADSILLASFLNISSVIEKLCFLEKDIAIICSGTNGQYSLDDGLAASLIIQGIIKRERVLLDDSSILLASSLKEPVDIHFYLKDCFHLKLLQQRGFQEDIDFCLSQDLYDNIPHMLDGKFVI